MERSEIGVNALRPFPAFTALPTGYACFTDRDRRSKYIRPARRRSAGFESGIFVNSDMNCRNFLVIGRYRLQRGIESRHDPRPRHKCPRIVLPTPRRLRPIRLQSQVQTFRLVSLKISWRATAISGAAMCGRWGSGCSSAVASQVVANVRFRGNSAAD